MASMLKRLFSFVSFSFFQGSLFVRGTLGQCKEGDKSDQQCEVSLPENKSIQLDNEE